MTRKRRDAYQPKGHFQQNLPIFLLMIMLNYNQMMLELVSPSFSSMTCFLNSVRNQGRDLSICLLFVLGRLRKDVFIKIRSMGTSSLPPSLLFTPEGD